MFRPLQVDQPPSDWPPYKYFQNLLQLLIRFTGIGIDDMFVIVQCLDNIEDEEETRELEEKIGLTMKRAGISITVTSLTDVLAFGIGSITVITRGKSHHRPAASSV